MKLSKFTVILAVLLISILAIGAVSAESVDDSDIVAVTDGDVGDIQESIDDAGAVDDLSSADTADETVGDDSGAVPADTTNSYDLDDDSYSTYFNEDGTIQEIKPTLRGVGPVKATQRVHIDRYSSIQGADIQYCDTTNYFQGWKTVFAKAGDKVCFNELDFGRKAPKSVTFYVKAPQGGKVVMTAGKTATFDIPATAEWQEVTIPMPYKAKGMQNLSVESASDTEMEIDWVRFK